MAEDHPNNDAIVQMVEELRKSNDLLREQIRISRDWRIPLRNGLASGLGTVIGATLLVSILLGVLKPFEKIETLGPGLERLAEEIRSTRKR
jgi:tetrahydromethanopterin S-methyltransferase subunit F